MVNPTTEQLEQEEAIEQLELRAKYIKRKNDLESLSEDERFKNVISEGYFEEECIRLNGMLRDPYVLRENKVGQIMDQSAAISQLRQYFITVYSMGSQFEEEASEALEDELAIADEG